MSEDYPSTNGSGLSWFQRLFQVLSGEPRDREELLELLRDAQRRNLFDVDAQAMIEGVLQVSEMQVRDIMIPRAQMVVIEKDARLEDVLPIVIESGHSRFPVIGDNRDEVTGIVLAKDFLRHFVENPSGNFSIREYLRPATFIPENKRLNILLKEFRASRNHMALVVDEYGGVAGLVTIEDVLEQIVGEIDDEHDIDGDSAVLKHNEARYTVKAQMPVEDFNNYFKASFAEDDYDTIGAVAADAFGHMPRRGEKITLGPFRFKVVRADNRRIHLLEVTLDKPIEPKKEED